MKTRELISFIGGILAIVGVIFGAYFYIDNTYALAEEVKQFKQEYQYDKALNFLNKAQERIWTIKERHGEKPKDMTVREELLGLELKVKEMQDRVKTLEKK